MEYYYGFNYQGRDFKYDFLNATKCDTPYQALKDANIKWNKATVDISRLLVVFKYEETNGTVNKKERAYFQFTDEIHCLAFIDDQSEIIWSNENERKWNGNGKMMITSN